MIFKDEIESLREESQRLYDSGVRILIALGHAGYDVDQKVAEQVIKEKVHSFQKSLIFEKTSKI